MDEGGLEAAIDLLQSPPASPRKMGRPTTGPPQPQHLEPTEDPERESIRAPEPLVSEGLTNEEVTEMARAELKRRIAKMQDEGKLLELKDMSMQMSDWWHLTTGLGGHKVNFDLLT